MAEDDSSRHCCMWCVCYIAAHSASLLLTQHHLSPPAPLGARTRIILTTGCLLIMIYPHAASAPPMARGLLLLPLAAASYAVPRTTGGGPRSCHTLLLLRLQSEGATTSDHTAC